MKKIHATTMELAMMKSMLLNAIVKQDSKEIVVNNDPATQSCANMAALALKRKMVIVAIVSKVSVVTIAKLRITVSRIYNVYWLANNISHKDFFSPH